MFACESILAGWLLWLCPLLSTWSYLIVFLVNLICSASIFLPVPGFALVFFLPGLGFNPWLLGLFGGFGAAAGELTGYAVGYGGMKLAARKKRSGSAAAAKGKQSWPERAKRWSKKRGIFAVVFVFAMTPLPDDVIGIMAGAIGYDVRKYFLAALAGKLVMFTVLAWGGYFGMDWVLGALGGWV